MRKPEYISPSSLAKFYNDRAQYYIDYISTAKPGREPQNHHMAVGSAFDAYVKAYLHKKLIGNDPKYEERTLFEAQVEPHQRIEAEKAGREVFNAYVSNGCLADLLLELEKCIGQPKFESEIRGLVSKNVHNVPFLGRPDIYFLTADGCRVIFDWKVNGFYGKSNVSPLKGYVKLFDDGAFKRHPDAAVFNHKGIKINVNEKLENLKIDWADQFAIYAWLCGESIGSDFVVAVDQVCCDNSKTPRKIRFAQHRLTISADYQHQLYDKSVVMWNAISSGHIFFEMDRASSDARCKLLEQRAQTLKSGENDAAMFFKANAFRER